MRARTTHARRRSCSGETLAEALVSLVIVALALLMVPLGLTVAARIRASAEQAAGEARADLGDSADRPAIEGLTFELVGDGGAPVVPLQSPVVRRSGEDGPYYYG